ncbi:acidic mammalian chitinase-like [Belonocnema kinseyi]|uniref:acidic mammalian chitinase-like n=1 Tax=Belonocnema kinseyi TaxID=2817044 RepID=UPI00143CDFD8|nr:acidic mammalian chitinase-like [Belonocnema kinseyi]
MNPESNLSTQYSDESVSQNSTHDFRPDVGSESTRIILPIIIIGENGFRRIIDLRKRNRRFKTLTATAESLWDDNVERLENKIFFNPTLRKILVNNVVNFVQKCELNGIEIYSQYLAENNAVAFDKQNFVLLLKALREKFDKRGLILALAVDAYESTADKYDIKEVSKYISFINLRAYHFHGDSDVKQRAKAGHIAPLHPSSQENTEEQKLNVDYIMKHWLSQGTPPYKLILGTTFNGISYTLANVNIVGRDAPVVVNPKYYLPTISYYYTCLREKNHVWTHLWEKEQRVPYISKMEKMIAYENVASIKLKAQYAKRMRLGGVFADSIDGDDFSGYCGVEPFTLLKAMSRA